MITLEYTLRKMPSNSRDLREVDESAIHYDLFLADIVLRVGDADMSAPWGWIPIIDFAVCLDRIAHGIATTETQSFEFTESENRIDFALRDGLVEIQTTYAAPRATVALDEFRLATREFLIRVLDDLSAKCPTLGQNAYIRRIYPKSLVHSGKTHPKGAR